MTKDAYDAYRELRWEYDKKKDLIKKLDEICSIEDLGVRIEVYKPNRNYGITGPDVCIYSNDNFPEDILMSMFKTGRKRLLAECEELEKQMEEI